MRGPRGVGSADVGNLGRRRCDERRNARAGTCVVFSCLLCSTTMVWMISSKYDILLEELHTGNPILRL